MFFFIEFKSKVILSLTLYFVIGIMDIKRILISKGFIIVLKQMFIYKVTHMLFQHAHRFIVKVLVF